MTNTRGFFRFLLLRLLAYIVVVVVFDIIVDVVDVVESGDSDVVGERGILGERVETCNDKSGWLAT